MLSSSEAMHTWKVIPSEPHPTAANTGHRVEEASRNWAWPEGGGPGLMAESSADDNGELKEVVLKEVLRPFTGEGRDEVDEGAFTIQVKLVPSSMAVKL